MIIHNVKVYPSKIHLPKKKQLAWKLAEIASDNSKLNKKSYLDATLNERAAVTVAGPAANFLLAIIIFTFINMTVGKDMTPAIIQDVQKEIFPEIEKALLNLLHISGYPDVKFLKKVDF